MDTKDVLDRVLNFIQELAQFHAELSQGLPDLRVVVDNSRNYSDVKKTPSEKYFTFRARKGRIKTRKKAQAFISQKRRLKQCQKISEINLKIRKI